MTKNRIKKSRRIETIDIAKAITIFCVILGHTTGNLDTPMFRRVLYAFHMPLFFLLAGLSIKPKVVYGLRGWGAFLYKNILALMAPYLVWGLVYAPFSYPNMGALFYGSWEALTRMETLTSLWYLPCFFVSRIIVQIVVNIAEYAKVKSVPLWCGIAALPLIAAGLFIPHSENGVPWCADIALAAGGGCPSWNRSQKSLSDYGAAENALAGIVLYWKFASVLRGNGFPRRRAGAFADVQKRLRKSAVVSVQQRFRKSHRADRIHVAFPAVAGIGASL